MRKYFIPTSMGKNDIRRLQKKLGMTQGELADVLNVSKKTIERWETWEKEITGPVTLVIQMLLNEPELLSKYEIPEQVLPLRLTYMFRNQLCTIIDVDENRQKIEIRNYQTELLYTAFGKITNPSYQQYEEFLESRCIPKNRDNIKAYLRQLNLPFYDPMLIIEKTQGKMAEDEFYLMIERK